MPPANDVSHALSRIRGFLGHKKEAERATRDIRLGLERIVRVIPDLQEWQGVHVGGTNGKGSICAFLSGLFTLSGISYGRFVSPAFPEKYNAISINGRHVNPRMYEMEARSVESTYQRILRGWRFRASENPGPLSPFELETATAFRVFNKMRVQYGIVEVGMGGATDATNAMRRKAVTVISKIDLDHQEYLGRTIEEIAKVKAGIMRPGVPCIVDHTNDNAVIKVLRQHASSIGTQISLTWKAEPFLSTLNSDRWQLEDYQKQNLLCAALAFRHLFPYKEINLDKLLELEPYLPGRMEWVDVSKLTDDRYKAPLLVDAAHNLLGVRALARYVDSHLRSDEKPVTWVIGFSSSKTKPFAEMIETLVRPQDNVAFVEYEQQSNEPQATPAPIGREICQAILQEEDQLYDGDPNVVDAMQWATSKARSGNIVFTGSLYLVRDFYKLKGVHRSREMRTRRPGSSQLWRFSKLWRQRPLTKDEYKEFRRAKWNWHLSRMDDAMKKIQPSDSPAQEQERDQNEVEASSSSPPAATARGSTAERPKPEFEEVIELQRKVFRHRRQVRGYREALKSIGDDIEYETQHGEPTSEPLARLREDAELLRQQADKHHEALEETMEQLRNHPDAAKQFALTHQEIFGRPSPRTPSPFMERTELDPEEIVEEQPEEEEVQIPEPVQDEGKKDFWGRPEGVDELPTPESAPKGRKNRFK